MLCVHCEEPVTGEEIAAGMTIPITMIGFRTGVEGKPGLIHRECMIRSVLGSVTHLRGRCREQGGDEDCHACEEGLTKREAARATYEFMLKREEARTRARRAAERN